jgi:hypothetical protein
MNKSPDGNPTGKGNIKNRYDQSLPFQDFPAVMPGT